MLNIFSNLRVREATFDFFGSFFLLDFSAFIQCGQEQGNRVRVGSMHDGKELQDGLPGRPLAGLFIRRVT